MIEYEYNFSVITPNNGNNMITADCNEITFINAGSLNVWINGIVYLPPEYQIDGLPAIIPLNNRITFSGRFGEIDRTQYYIQFQSEDEVAQVIVIKKIYKNKDQVKNLLKNA